MHRFADAGSALVVTDPDRGRAERIAGLIQAVVADEGTGIPDAPAAGGVACVGLTGEDDDGARCAAFARRGWRVVAVGRASDHWPIAARCRVVVSGARALLDDRDGLFAERLVELVGAWRLEFARAAMSACAITDQMRALGIVGTSAALRELFERIRRVADLSDVPVCITGETGTGKELVARALHALDPRRGAGPFVAINCGAIPAALAESELFGHRRGAFTGALRDRTGLVRSAEGGTLFLDEVGELGVELQAKLLRVLQERTLLPVGAEREVPVDVRVIAATHRDLEAAVAQGRFREDLYFRLSVVGLHVPALVDRREDIAALVAHFLAQQAAAGSPPREASDAFCEALSRASLPGNVRQLQNLVLRALALSPGGRALDLADLPADLLAGVASSRPIAASMRAGEVPGDSAASLNALFAAEEWNLDRCMDACERVLVREALARAGNQAAAARLLGVTPRCVYSKLRKHTLG